MNIAIGSDHAGFHLKQALLDYVHSLGYTCRDFGAYDTGPVDYPDVARAVAESVARGDHERGILICGTGIGVCMTANKVKGIRAALCHEPFSAYLSRSHNDANVLCMGGRIIGPGLACEIVKVWLQAEFSGDRHARRVAKINALDAAR